MAGLADLLQGILGQIGQSGGPSVTAVGDHANPAAMQAQFARFGLPQSAPVQAPQMAPQGLAAPQAPQPQPMQEQAPQAAPGGGFGDVIGGILQNIVNPQASAKNQTVGWLTKQGLDQGTATLLASNKPALQSYLLQRSKTNGPTEFDQRAAAAQQYGLDPSTPEGKNFILSGKLASDDAPKTTSDIQNYQFAVQNGYKGDFATWAKDNKGGVNVNLPGAPNIGTIPSGWAASQDPATGEWSMKPITNGPEDPTKTNEVKASNQSTSSDVITNAAAKIRELSKQPGSTGLVGAGASYIPNSPAAEVYRQVEVLKANAKASNLQAMREASPTGGALGNVSNTDIQLLADKSGALDPKSPYFQEQLDDYEKTLLRIVYGNKVGDAVFEQTRSKDGAQTGGKTQERSFTDNKQVFDGIASGQLKVGDTIILNGKKMRIDP